MGAERSAGFADPLQGSSPYEPIAPAKEIDLALLERPRCGLRTWLILSFAALLLASLGIALTDWIVLTKLDARLNFLAAADQIDSELLQARRGEKNFFLYAKGLEEARAHVIEAERLLDSIHAEFGAMVGRESLAVLRANLNEYRASVDELLAGRNAEAGEIEERMRLLGARMLTSAEELSARERSVADRMMRIQKRVPAIFFITMLVISVIVGSFLYLHILRRLRRLDDVARQIGRGDLSSIAPSRRFRDEFTNVTIALNHMARELTERHLVLVRSHKLRAVGRLTAGIAHELNNPINNLMLTAAMLDEDYDGLDDAERREMVTDLLTQSERAQRIVRNLLDFSRETEMVMEEIDIADPVRHALELVDNHLRLSRVSTSVDLAQNLPPVRGDANTLAQVFVNLFLNAIDAMPQGGNLRVFSSFAQGEGVSVHVADTGSGIPDQIVNSVFDPFFTTKPVGSGTGLGLSVSLGIIKKHGGNITVSSRPGEGTTFTVCLPAAGESDRPAQDDSAGAES